MPRNLNLYNLRNKSNNTTKISSLTIEENSDHFLEFELKDENQISKKDGDIEVQMSLVTQKRLIELLFSKKVRVIQNFNESTNSNIITNGSCHSIINWSLREEKKSGSLVKMDIIKEEHSSLLYQSLF